MTTEFRPVFQGTAVQLKKDFSNIREVALFVGGSIITNTRSDALPSIRMADNAHILNNGQYALRYADGTIKKMYSYEFEELFGTDAAQEVDVQSIPNDPDYTSYLAAVIKQNDKNALMWPVYGALEATLFKNARRNRAMNKPLFQSYAKMFEEATGETFTLEIARKIFGSHDMSYKGKNGRFSFVLAVEGTDEYLFYVNVDATSDDVQAALNRQFLRENPDFYANYKNGEDEEGDL